MATALVIGAIATAGAVGFLALGRARGSGYARLLGLMFTALAVLMVVIAAGGYAGRTHRHDCPPGLGVVKVAYFGLLIAIVVMLLAGLGVLSKVPSAREGGLGRDLGLTLRITAVAVVLGVVYIVLAYFFVAFLVIAALGGEWLGFAIILAFGVVPAGLLAYQARNAERLALRATKAHV